MLVACVAVWLGFQLGLVLNLGGSWTILAVLGLGLGLGLGPGRFLDHSGGVLLGLRLGSVFRLN